MTKPNSPRVIAVIGNENSFTIGLMSALTTPNTRPEGDVLEDLVAELDLAG